MDSALQAQYDKNMEIIHKSEETADKILVNKQELKEMDRRRQDNRVALRLVEKSEEKNVWITIGSMMIKMKREKAIELLKKDQQQISLERNLIHSEQKILVNKHRDVEFKAPYLGTNLKPLSREEIADLRVKLPMF